jgi:iron complex outermembrane receptor protein
MPSRFDRDLAEPAPPLTLVSGGKNFLSETVIAYELGYKTQFSASASGSISVYYNQYDRLRSLSLTPVTVVPLVYQNGLEGDTYGAEMSSDFQLADGWRFHAGYSLLKERIRVKAGSTDFFNGLDETSDPQNQISLRSSFDLSRRVEFDALYRWVDVLRVNNGGSPAYVPSYGELNLRLAWNFAPGATMALVGENLLHAHHVEFGPPTAGREELQRNLYAKLSWAF